MHQHLYDINLKVKRLINARSQRERVLLLVTGLVIIWTILYTGIITPATQALNDNSEEKQNLDQEYQATKHELVLLREKLQKDTSPKPNAELQQLDTILQEHNRVLEHYQEKLIKPDQVPLMLDKLLGNFSGLTFVQIETLAPQALVHDKFKETSENASLYRHSIRMTFTGEYQDLLSYVKQVEQLPYPIWWGNIEFSITQFPQAKIVLTFYTLSQHKNWIGV